MVDPSDFGSDTSGDSGSSLPTSDIEIEETYSGSTRSSKSSSNSPKDPDMDYITPAEETPSNKGWVTKVDFSKPYVLVVRDRAGHYHYSKQDMVVMHDSEDWVRIAEDTSVYSDDEKQSFPKNHQVWERDLKPIMVWRNKRHWLNFCDLAIDQGFGDPNELLEHDLEALLEAKEEVYWPPGTKPTSKRVCQVCGETTKSDNHEIVELDLHNTRKTPVCASHSVEELAENGLLS